MAGRDSIVAISTGAGRAAIAVLRISGPQAGHVLEALCGRRPEPRRATLARLKRADGAPLDEALALFFSGPHSFTGEDMAELHIHGGRAVQAAVLDAALGSVPGLRLAEAGEFARRAFLNGKLDLAEVEGLAALIDSETEWQRRQAIRLMQGEMGEAAREWRAALIEALGFLDASLDFSDEGDVEDDVAAAAWPLLADVAATIRRVASQASTGERLRDGFVVAITGPPNAGKSSLINAIAGRDVAIVAASPGTTRDVIELRCDLSGLPVRFLDTAGLRDSDDPVEQEGIRRARAAADLADLVLCLTAVDSHTEQRLVAARDTLSVRTKCDIEPGPAHFDARISSVTGAGIPELLALVRQRLEDMAGGEPPLVSDRRQRRCLEQALVELDSILERSDRGAQFVSDTEIVAEHVRRALRALELLVGRVDVEDVLDQVFARFCIGK